MKLINKTLFVGAILTAVCFFEVSGQDNSRTKRKDLDPRIDYRIDNIGYWRNLVKLGILKPAPKIKVPAAIERSSIIKSNSALNVNSPDVLITNGQTHTQSENSIFINPNDPNNPLNGNNSIQLNPTQNSQLRTSVFSSTNTGNSWSGDLEATDSRADPSMVINNNGRFFNGYINQGNGQTVAYSDNGGNTWIPVAAGNTSSGLLDKNHLWIDNQVGSPFEGNLYNAWTPLGTANANDGEIMLTRSTTDGISWSTPINISQGVNAGSHNQGVNLQTGPNGEVYATWAIYDNFPSDETALGFARSTDGGVTFSNATRILSNIRGIRDSRTSKHMRVNSFPSMAVDVSGGPANGTIYIVWTNIGTPGTNNAGSIDIYLIRSIDQGNTWSTPVKVNQDPIGNENYFPWVTCDPVTGNLSVIFYSDRNVSSTQVEVFVANSFDAGATWDDFRVSDVAFTPSPIPGLSGDYFGDYLGIAARNGVVYPCWTDNRSGDALAYVSPFVIQNPGCLPNLTITNNINGGLQIFKVSNTITATNTISNAASVSYQAGSLVKLTPGFHAQSNVRFLARIAACNQRTTRTPISINRPSNTLVNSSGEAIGLTIYPNPNEGAFTIRLPKSTEKQAGGKYSIGVYTLMGTPVFAKTVQTSGEVKVNLKNQPKGVYIIKYVANEKVMMSKVIYQ